MNPQIVANNILEILDVEPEKDPDGTEMSHAAWMLQGIAQGYIQHEKAHRWLGYAQAILVIQGPFTLEGMKTANREARQ